MLTEICNYLKNWFDYKQPKYYGDFTIENGSIKVKSIVREVVLHEEYGEKISAVKSMDIKNGQYFRIVGSIFNDGVHTLDDELTDEEFEGSVWLMAIPVDVQGAASDIKAWQDKYGGVDSDNMSPFQSESFGGYSYSKGGTSNNSASSVPTWQSIFADRLARYKKL